MIWQDIVLTAGGWAFIIALIPSLIGKHKPAITTSFLNGSILMAFSGVYFSFSLTASGIAAVIVGILWYLLAFQKYKQMRNKTVI